MSAPSTTPQSPRHLRVFLASPGDVADERALALTVLEQLQYDPLLRGLITIETVAWDKPGAGTPMLVTMTPQEAIKRGLPTPAECDIVVVILWSRIGTPLPSNWKKPNGSPYHSGTEWEYCNALEAVEQHGKPKLLLYRRTEKLLLASDDPDFDEKSRQSQLVKDFFAALRNPNGSIRGGVNEYATPAQFKDNLTLHLHQLISDLVPELQPNRIVYPQSDDPYYLRNRPAMLQNVCNFWIKGVLEQSLYAVARLELGLTTKPDAIADVWNVLVQRPEQTPQSLPHGTRISTVFDEFGQTLLILGAPGTGKTTLLLELTKDLLARAEQDPNHPLPVVFNLSSWAVQQYPLSAWLVDELWERYQVPRKHAQTWIDKELILPLLDGLDEVAPACRSACVEAINAFRQEHGLVPMAVCSRLADYEVLTAKLRLQRALVVQSLTRQQIDHYLTQAGEPLVGVRSALQNDETLWELLGTPLMLSIAALAYQWRLAAEMQTVGTLEERRTHLFATYTEAMFKRRGKATPYSRQQTVQWLGWLAAAMARQNQSVFYLEWLQPNWLPGRIPPWMVAWGTGLLIQIVVGLVSGLISGLAFGHDAVLMGGMIGAVSIGLTYSLVIRRIKPIGNGVEPIRTLTGRSPLKAWLSVEIVGWLAGGLFALPVVGLAIWMGSGLVGALVLGLIVYRDVIEIGKRASPTSSRIQPDETSTFTTWRWSQFKEGLIGGLAYGLVYGLVYGLINWQDNGLAKGLIICLGCGLMNGQMSVTASRVQPVEILIWRWSLFKKDLVKAGLRLLLSYGLFAGLAAWLGSWLDDKGQLFGLVSLMGMLLFVGLLVNRLSNALVAGEIAARSRPNEGMWRSLRNALLSGLAYGLIIGLFFGLVVGLFFGLANGLLWGLFVGLFFGLAFGLEKGGRACLQHLMLRFLLWRNNYAPWHYVRFLDYAAERVFLRKVGGGYVFIHRMLLEYFATLYPLNSEY